MGRSVRDEDEVMTRSRSFDVFAAVYCEVALLVAAAHAAET